MTPVAFKNSKWCQIEREQHAPKSRPVELQLHCKSNERAHSQMTRVMRLLR